MVLGKAAALVGAGAGAAGMAATPLLAPAAVRMVGFGKHGIVSGSWAAAMMRSYGGRVPPSSLCAILQRMGMKGLGTSTVAVIELAAAALALLCAFLLFKRVQLPAAAAAGAMEVNYRRLPSFAEEEPADVEQLPWRPLLMLEPTPASSSYLVEEEAVPSTSSAGKQANPTSMTTDHHSSAESLHNPFAGEPDPLPSTVSDRSSAELLHNLSADEPASSDSMTTDHHSPAEFLDNPFALERMDR